MKQSIISINELTRQLVKDGMLKPQDVLKFRRLVQRYIQGNVKLVPKMDKATMSDFEKFSTIIIKG